MTVQVDPSCTSRPQRTHDLVVAGAGISGPVMALFLAHAGQHVELFERGHDPARHRRKNASSINITLCERGLSALETVVPRAAVFDISVHVDRRAIHALDGTVIHQPYSAFGDGLYCVAREDLRNLLVAHAAAHPRIRIHYEQEVLGYDPERATLDLRRSDTGERHQVAPRHLFAADGARSAIRRCLSGAKHFNYVQRYSDHGNLELRVAAEHVPEDWRRCVCLRIWPRGRRMVIAFPNIDGSYTCTLHLPLEGEDSFLALAADGAIDALFTREFPDLQPLIPDLQQQLRARQAIAMIMVKCSPWNVGDEVILIGDAAHSVWPSYGQGANATFESCELLARALRESPRAQWPAAMTRFAAQRRLDTDALADLCVDHFEELRDHVGSAKFLLLKQLERAFSTRTEGAFRSLYELVSFSRVPYGQACARARDQDTALEHLLALPHAPQLIESGNVDGLLAQARAHGLDSLGA